MDLQILKEIDQMSLPKGWTHERLISEAYETGRRIRKSGLPLMLGPLEVEHLTTLIGYLAKHAQAYREATVEVVSPQ